MDGRSTTNRVDLNGEGHLIKYHPISYFNMKNGDQVPPQKEELIGVGPGIAQKQRSLMKWKNNI